MLNYQERRVLIWGTTYPELSNKYLETVCTGGVFEDGRPCRLYPISLRYLEGDRRFHKYQWVKMRIAKNPSDTRPESYKVDRFSDIVCGERVEPTKDQWGKRAELIFKYDGWQFNSVESLLAAHKFNNTSLGVIRPREIAGIEVVTRPADEQQSFEEKLAKLRRSVETEASQGLLFDEMSETIPTELRRLDYVDKRIRVHWFCEGTECKGHKMQILDWEIAELMRREGDAAALAKVKSIFDLQQYDLRFFLGNLALHPSAFMILGIWYPKRVTGRLFL